MKLAVFGPIPWNRQSTRETREIPFSPVKFRFSVPELSALRYNSLRASIPSTWRTDVLGFQSAQSPKSSGERPGNTLSYNMQSWDWWDLALLPWYRSQASMHVLRRVTKPGFPEYDVREIISPRSETYKRSHKIAVLLNPFHYLLYLLLSSVASVHYLLRLLPTVLQWLGPSFLT